MDVGINPEKHFEGASVFSELVISAKMGLDKPHLAVYLLFHVCWSLSLSSIG